jgi:hypothetical protein
MAPSTTPVRGRSAALAGLTASVILLAGCGGSSSKSSTQTSPAGSTPSTTATSSGTSQTQPPAATGAGGQQSSGLSGARTVRASAGDLKAVLYAAGHNPKVGRPWPVGFTVTRAGRPARSSVSYEYLFGGAVVARRSHYTFTGSFRDTFQWPRSAVGYPLTFRAVIVSGGTTINLDYPVKVTA